MDLFLSRYIHFFYTGHYYDLSSVILKIWLHSSNYNAINKTIIIQCHNPANTCHIIHHQPHSTSLMHGTARHFTPVQPMRQWHRLHSLPHVIVRQLEKQYATYCHKALHVTCASHTGETPTVNVHTLTWGWLGNVWYLSHRSHTCKCTFRHGDMSCPPYSSRRKFKVVTM